MISEGVHSMTDKEQKPNIGEMDESDRLFYSESNMKALRESIKQMEEGKVVTFTWEEFEAFAKKCEEE